MHVKMTPHKSLKAGAKCLPIFAQFIIALWRTKFVLEKNTFVIVQEAKMKVQIPKINLKVLWRHKMAVQSIMAVRFLAFKKVSILALVYVCVCVL